MAKIEKVGDDHRNGAVKNRAQFKNPKTRLMQKRNLDNGQIIDVKIEVSV